MEEKNHSVKLLSYSAFSITSSYYLLLPIIACELLTINLRYVTYCFFSPASPIIALCTGIISFLSLVCSQVNSLLHLLQ